jgi:hypothetical protein
MNNVHTEHVGKVFVVVRGMRRCLICERMFIPSEAAEHAATPCCPPPISLIPPLAGTYYSS